jgi:curved DNA-binding protein CbpA
LGIKEAYEVLSDAETRRSYDDWLGVPQVKRHKEAHTYVDEVVVDAKREWEQEMARQRIQRRVDEER